MCLLKRGRKLVLPSEKSFDSRHIEQKEGPTLAGGMLDGGGPMRTPLAQIRHPSTRQQQNSEFVVFQRRRGGSGVQSPSSLS